MYQSFDKSFYKLLASATSAVVAVLVVVLERLVDLLSPALVWKQNIDTRQSDTYDGSGFIVTSYNDVDHRLHWRRYVK